MLKDRSRNRLSLASPFHAPKGVYIIDPVHSVIGFSVRHAVFFDVRGRFNSFEGILKLGGTHPSRSAAYMSIQTESLDTRDRERNAHLKGPAFFDSSTYPLMTFQSIGITGAGDEAIRLDGNLRIRDVELPVPVDLEFGGGAQDGRGKYRVGFRGKATLSQSDWGLTWNAPTGPGLALVDDRMSLIIDISAVRMDPTVPA
ncbi:YceI family protein [Streptomyces sp. NPDC086077]|uniref:YceI family protein n=1 Tax=Streptomyces sp. NPDC086077 TaxID=3154862 RepID=UPI0034222EB7